MSDPKELYNKLFYGITMLLPYDSFDPMSPDETLYTIEEVIRERDQLLIAVDELRNRRNHLQSFLDDAEEKIQRLEIELNYYKHISKTIKDLYDETPDYESLLDFDTLDDIFNLGFKTGLNTAAKMVTLNIESMIGTNND
jgi:hypothetical protein